MSPSLYHPIFLYSVVILSLFTAEGIGNSSYKRIKVGYAKSITPALLLTLVFAIWLGQRPISGYYFGDTGTYAYSYELCKNGLVSDSDEWIWNMIMLACSKIMDVHGYLTIISIGYFGFSFWACMRLAPKNVLICLLFVFGAFSFFSYATNGIRNGLACSMTLVALSYLNGNKKNKIIAIAIALIAVNIHRTTMLPLTMAVVSLFLIKNFKQAYSCWIISILISLVAGGPITSFFAGLGFDDRLSYLTAEQQEGVFAHTGFRWDFLIYSMMPIILGYYIVIKKGIQDRTYSILLNTYTLANAFWVIVIRANYSNRFAYLSWFMYPIVLAYPLLCLDIWGQEQGKYLKRIMLAHIGFTWFVATIY